MPDMGVTETVATAMDVVASIVQETLKQSQILGGTITDYSRFAIRGSKTVDIPRRDQFAAASKAENTALTTQALTFSADTISLDQHKAVYAKLEKIAGMQSMVDVDGEIIQEMSRELALEIDRDVYVEMKLASAAAPDHRIAFAGATLAKADILEARKLLNIQNVSQEDRWLAVNPLHESELLAIAEFVEADKYAGATALANAELGRLFGFRVVMSNVVEDLNVIAYHRSAVGWAQMMAPEFDTDKDLANVAREFLLDVIYGVEVLDGGKRQVLLGTAV